MPKHNIESFRQADLGFDDELYSLVHPELLIANMLSQIALLILPGKLVHCVLSASNLEKVQQAKVLFIMKSRPEINHHALLF